MTEPDHHSDDEIVSAYLDGEATPAEVARVEAEPALQARLAAFRAGAALVAEVPRPDPAARDAHLARARAELSPAPDATVHDLEAARQRRTRTFIFSAAAVVAALVLGASLLPRLLDDDDTEQFTAVGSAIDGERDSEGSDRSAADSEASAAAPEADAVPPSTAPGLAEGGAIQPLPDLGSFAGRADLDAALDQELQAQRDARAFSSVPPDAVPLAASVCATDLLTADGELQDLLYGATAVLAGTDLEILVFATDPTSSANGPSRLYVVDRATCAPIVDGVETLTP